MIKSDDFFRFLKDGVKLGVFSIGMSISKIKQEYGEPTSITGNDNFGYLFYDELRLGFWGDKIDEIAIIFENNFLSFDLNLESLETIQTLGSNTKLNEVILILNYLAINWKSAFDINNPEHIYIETNVKVWVIFDLEKNSINRISYTGM